MDGWMMDGWIYGWMGGWLDGWMSGWIGVWVDGWVGQQHVVHAHSGV